MFSGTSKRGPKMTVSLNNLVGSFKEVKNILNNILKAVWFNTLALSIVTSYKASYQLIVCLLDSITFNGNLVDETLVLVSQKLLRIFM